MSSVSEVADLQIAKYANMVLQSSYLIVPKLLLSNSFPKAITVTNVIIDAVFPFGYSNMFDMLQLVVHSVLASRILFHLRSSDDRAHETHTWSLVSAIRGGQPSQMQTNGIRSEFGEV
ncbi:hypothetical protein EDB19DRAFT_1905245 [Suillus lakei]|nr:hypothetical protein EDB19DRAFT_1905245 [Suillus lakei]